MNGKAHAFCMSATPFAADGSIDETEFRLHLRRMVDAGVGLYLASPGSGEGHALSCAELKRVYEIGVEEAKGKVPVFANPPESRTAAQMKERIRLAIEAGVDVVQIYALDCGHGIKPTAAEQEQYYRDILDEIDYPVAISIHPAVGYVTPIRIVKTILDDYRQVVAATVMVESTYLVELMDDVGPRISYYNSNRTLAEGLILGTKGALVGHANIAPKLCQSVFDDYRLGNIVRFQANYKNMLRLFDIVARFGTNAQWIKMAMQILNVPGHGNGRVRRPLMPLPQTQLDEMRKALEAMKLRQIEGLT